MFRFRQFHVRHDRCAMKVGTDGVLLGAWARVEGCRRLLDIGTGTGLIALMAAQRQPEGRVVAVELDAEAAGQARENVAASPFADRIEVVCEDVRIFRTSLPFDCILCNPPFFSEQTLPDRPSRALARHASLLSFEELLASVDRLLAADGTFHAILPCSEYKSFVSQSLMFGLCLTRQCLVYTVRRKPPRRVLLSFSRAAVPVTEQDELTLIDAQGNRSEAYDLLTKEFYL